MNHLEQLVAEWLSYKGYFVRTTVRVGKRPEGGFEGELDVVGFHPGTQHLIHVECSLDAESWPKREVSFHRKFQQGQNHIRPIFSGIELPAEIDKVAVLTFGGKADEHRRLGGGRLVTTSELIAEISDGLKGTSPSSGAVPENLPLLRTIQLTIDALGRPKESQCLVPEDQVMGGPPRGSA